MFLKGFFLRVIKSQDCVVKGELLTNDKILGVTKLKAFANDKLNIAKVMISLFDRVENTVGKEENAGCCLSMLSIRICLNFVIL